MVEIDSRLIIFSRKRCFIERTHSSRTLRPLLVSTKICRCKALTDIVIAALYFVGGVRVTYSTGIAAGGNLAYWTSYLVTLVFTFITAAVIAEVCSASPSAGSIYLWAAEAGGPRFGRLLGFIVAWWSTTAWTTFCASTTSWNYAFNARKLIATARQHPSCDKLHACCTFQMLPLPNVRT